MILQEVNSSNIKLIGYDGWNSSLHIVMKSFPDTVYVYLDVPPGIFLSMEKSESKGRYFVNEIKGKYKFEKYKL